MSFPIDDAVGAWVPHGRFVIEGAAQGPLRGLRFAVKDLFDVAGHPTGAGNPTWLATHPVPTRHSPVVAQLLEAGATLMGKVLTDELAYSLHGDNAHYGAPRNTRAPSRVTGGSSSGSAAAGAAGLVDFALATDTGGSTRVPASYCGLWGLRTTHGALAVDGLVPLSPGFDTATWLARDALVFDAVGRVLLPPDVPPLRGGVQAVHVFDDAWAQADAEFAAPLLRVTDVLAGHAGVLPRHSRIAADATLHDWREAYNRAGAHEAWRVHGAWIRAAQPRFGEAIAGRWQMAGRTTDAEAATAHATKDRVRAHVRSVLGAHGVAVLPSAASLAPLRDASAEQVNAVRLRTMAITCIAGLAGLPQVSLPLQSAGGEPLGVSLLGPAGSDRVLIELARRLHDEIA
jgi:amidase